MKLLKASLKWVGIFLGSLILLILILGSVIWFKPSLVLNDRSLQWAVQKQSVLQFEHSIPEMHLSVKNRNIFRQKIVLDIAPHCAELKVAGLSWCSEKFHFELLIGLPKFKPTLYGMGPVDVIVPSFRLESRPSEKVAEEKKSKPSRWIPRVSDDFVLAPLLIDAKKIEIISEAKKTELVVLLKGKKETPNSSYILRLDGTLLANRDPSRVEVVLDAEISEQLVVDFQLSAQGFTPKKAPLLKLKALGHWDLRKMRGKLQGDLEARKFISSFPTIRVKNWVFERQDLMSFSGKIEAGYLLETPSAKPGSALSSPKIQLQLAVGAEATESTDGPIDFSLVLTPIQQYGMKLNGEVAGSYEISKSDLALKKFNIALKSNSFQKTVEAFKRTRLAVPAPFNELKGELSFVTRKPTFPKIKKEPFVFPFDLKTNLRSASQALVTDTQGDFQFTLDPFSGVLNFQADLNDVALQAPNLDPVTPMPSVSADSRVIEKSAEKREDAKEKAKDSSGPSVFVDIKVRTPQKPVRILHKLLDPYAAFQLQVDVRSPQPPKVEVNFEPVKINYLKREATLEKLKIELDEEKGGLKMEGRVSIKKAEYMLYADILQQYGKTEIKLTADPPLPESDIVSLILFNQMTAELDSGSSNSTNDTRTAMTNRAIGFFSFWVLSSTPVESVNFDSTTGVYSARVKLPGGLSATVGSNWDKAQEVGIRKRLGRRWVLSADVVTNSDGETRQESMVEWYKRY